MECTLYRVDNIISEHIKMLYQIAMMTALSILGKIRNKIVVFSMNYLERKVKKRKLKPLFGVIKFLYN